MQINPAKLANRSHRVNGPIRRGVRRSMNPPSGSFGSNPAPAPQVPGANAMVPMPTRGAVIQEMGDNQTIPQFARGGVVGGGYMPPPTSPYGPTEVVDRPQIRDLGVNQPQAVVPLKPKKSSHVYPGQVPQLIRKYSGQ